MSFKVRSVGIGYCSSAERPEKGRAVPETHFTFRCSALLPNRVS